MNFHRTVRHDEREETGLRPEPRRTDAEALLAELKRLLDEEQPASAQPASDKGPSAAFSTLWELEDSGPDASKGEAKVGASGGDPLPGLQQIIAERSLPADQSIGLGSRKRKWLVPVLALSAVTVIGAGLAFKSGVPDLPKNASVARTQGPAPIQPGPAAAPTLAPAAAPASAAGFVMKDEPGLEHVPAGGSELHTNETPGSNGSPPAAAAVDPRSSASSAFDAAAAAKSVETPIGPEPASPAATAVPEAQHQEPAPEVVAKPGGAPEATGALTSSTPPASGATGSAPPAAAVKPHAQSASHAEASAEPTRSAMPKNAPIKPAAAKKTERRAAIKKARATSKAAAESPKQRLDVATPNAPAIGQAAAEAPPAPATTTPANEQQQGGLPGAFSYLVRLPAALIQRATNPNEAK